MTRLPLLGATALMLTLSACSDWDHTRQYGDARSTPAYDRYEENRDMRTYNDPINCPLAQARKSRCYHPWYSHRDPHNPDDRWMELSENDRDRDRRSYRR